MNDERAANAPEADPVSVPALSESIGSPSEAHAIAKAQEFLSLLNQFKGDPLFEATIQGIGAVGPGTEGGNACPEWVRLVGLRIQKAFGYDPTAQQTPREDGRDWGVIFGLLPFIREHEFFGPTAESPDTVSRIADLFAEFVRMAVAEAMAGPHERAVPFMQGFADGLEGSIEPNGLPSKAGRRFLLDLVLLVLWPRVQQCKTSTELYRSLGGNPDVSGSWLGDLDSFQRYIRELGIRLGSQGRPDN